MLLVGVSGVDITPHVGPAPSTAFNLFDTAPKIMRRIDFDAAVAATLGPVFWATRPSPLPRDLDPRNITVLGTQKQSFAVVDPYGNICWPR
jgi:hypothetical protein